MPQCREVAPGLCSFKDSIMRCGVYTVKHKRITNGGGNTGEIGVKHGE